MNLPGSVRNCVRSLHEGNGCELALPGAQARRISIRVGIRQGCPLSLSLFAICGDLLPRRRRRLLPAQDFLRTYADDLAVVSGEFQALLRAFGRIFMEGSRVSRAWP